MKITLSQDKGFTLIPQGRNTLKITDAAAVPSGKPQAIELKFEAENGGTMSANYKFSNDKAMFVLSLIIRAMYGNVDEFETSQVKELIGRYLEVDVKHTEKPSTKTEGEVVTFANISKVIGEGDMWEKDLADDTDDVDFESTIDISDEDLPF